MRHAVLALVSLATAANAAPCKRCVIEVPKHGDPVPLVVVLHGDREHAPAAAARWRKAVAKRGWALLALECPTELGCKDSFWKWDGDPSWVIDQAKAIAGIDPQRIYLVGWSGGASYIGWRATAWAQTFAAIVIHGGGMPPSSTDCATRHAPVYFLVGDKNPLHGLNEKLRAYFDACHHEVEWDPLAGADHDKEERALTVTKAATILDWLGGRQLE